MSSRFPEPTETFVARELSSLRTRGIELEVVSLHRPCAWSPDGAPSGLAGRIHYVPSPPAGARDPNRFWADQVAAHFRRRGVSHVHAHFAWGAARVSQLVARSTGLPYSLTAHAGDIYGAGAAATLRAYADGAAFVLTCTRHNRRRVRQLVRTLPHPPRVACFYHGVPDHWFAVRRDPVRGEVPRIVSVGRLVPKKGFPDLIEAVRLLVRRGRAVECVIVGDGPEYPALRRLVRRGELEAHVTFRRRLSQRGLRRLHQSASVYVHAGIVAADGDRDGIPNAVLEAMACGLPVVATALPSTRELLAPDAGMMARPADPGSLARSIGALLRAPRRATTLASRATARVRHRFHQERTSERLAAFWTLEVQGGKVWA